jgi:hypothetical protein
LEIDDANERKQTVHSGMSRFAIGESGEPSEVPPICGAGIAAESIRQCSGSLGGSSAIERLAVIDPRLEVVW